MLDPMHAVDLRLQQLRTHIKMAMATAAEIEVPASVHSLGALIREIRTARDMSLEEVATASGMTKSHIWELEQDRTRNPTVKAMDGLARGLGVPFLTLCAAALRGLKVQP